MGKWAAVIFALFWGAESIGFTSADDDRHHDYGVLLAALAGALILSRAKKSTQPLDTVQRFFTTSLTQAAGCPTAK